MLTFENFTGINNVLPAHRLSDSELRRAMNVDIGLSGEIRRRRGFRKISTACHDSLWQADGFLLAVDTGDLVAISPTGIITTIHPSLGPDRVWYVNLPDGRTAFSNGLICGVTDGGTMTSWGVSAPPTAGALTAVAGGLEPGRYIYRLAYRRADGLEGDTISSNPFELTGSDGGIMLTGLPVEPGYSINVYLTTANGERSFLAGNTTMAMFVFNKTNADLQMPLHAGRYEPAPAGKPLAFWRGRTLVAVGPVLYASRPNSWEHFDLSRDFKQFSADITLLCPVDDGLYVGTETELAFLAGTSFDELKYTRVIEGRTVLGSGVPVRGELIGVGEGRTGDGSAMVCIADRTIVVGMNEGKILRLGEGKYQTDPTEVSATFRVVDGIPQYVALPR